MWLTLTAALATTGFIVAIANPIFIDFITRHW
jgi:hypothetical protein